MLRCVTPDTGRMMKLPLAVAALLALAGTPAQAAPATSLPGDGTYRIGVDVYYGLYRSTGNSYCYWERRRDATTSGTGILANGRTRGQVLVSLLRTDRFVRTENCATFTRLDTAAQRATSTKTTIPGDGDYLTGPDFRPGVYRSQGNTNCYWERARRADGGSGSIITNDYADGQITVSIPATDKMFSVSHCKTWRRIG
jgi:hypothetical protein